jgi:hypothetical protein
MANSYWEAKLKNFNHEKLQDDEYRLIDFIRDKYERKKWVGKGKDPMTLIYEGKDPLVNAEKKKDEEEQDDSESEEDVKTTKKNKTNFSESLKGNKKAEFAVAKKTDEGKCVQSQNLWEFNGDNNQESQEVSSQKNNVSGFSFINKQQQVQQIKQVQPLPTNLLMESSSGNSGGSLIDWNSTTETVQNSQTKDLIGNLSKVYSGNEVQITANSQPTKKNPLNIMNFNQPNINIQNTYYNGYPQSYTGAPNNGYNQGMPNYSQSQDNYNNPKHFNSNPNLNYNPYQYQQQNHTQQQQVKNSNLNPYSYQQTGFNPQPNPMEFQSKTPTMAPLTSNTGFNMNFVDLNLNQSKSTHEKTKEKADPFKNLVNLK